MIIRIIGVIRCDNSLQKLAFYNQDLNLRKCLRPRRTYS